MTREGKDGSWMITDIVFNYELNVHQARVIKVGDPKTVDHVDPVTLSHQKPWK